MVFSTAHQANDTYQLWTRFYLPTTMSVSSDDATGSLSDGGSVLAVSVPAWVAKPLNSAWALMIAFMVVNLWTVALSAGIYFTFGGWRERRSRRGRRRRGCCSWPWLSKRAGRDVSPSFPSYAPSVAAAAYADSDSDDGGDSKDASSVHPMAVTLYNDRESLVNSSLAVLRYLTERHSSRGGGGSAEVAANGGRGGGGRKRRRRGCWGCCPSSSPPAADAERPGGPATGPAPTSDLDRRHRRKRVWVWLPVGIATTGCLALQVFLGVFIPTRLSLGPYAPANPAAVYVPQRSVSDSRLVTAAIFEAEVPAALRAAGSARVATPSTRRRVRVEGPELLGAVDAPDGNGGRLMQQVARYSYGYVVSGADLGLQKHPDLVLNVTGACTTEYGWYATTSANHTFDGRPFPVDNYVARLPGGEPLSQARSLLDGGPPAGFFDSDIASFPDGRGGGNTSWAAFASVVGRRSWSPGSDPWYLTVPVSADGAAATNATDTPMYVLRGARPALSCWQSDRWSFRGASSSVVKLDALPGLDLPLSLRLILAQQLATPKIVVVAKRLGPAAALSSAAGSALGLTFDAGSASIRADLERLVLAAYVATANTLTDATLMAGGVLAFSNSTAGAIAAPPAGDDDGLAAALNATAFSVPNLARGEDGTPRPGVGDFVVVSSDATALSLAALVAVPVLFVSLFALSVALLRLPPLRDVRALGAEALFEAVNAKFPAARPTHQRGRPSWTL